MLAPWRTEYTPNAIQNPSSARPAADGSLDAPPASQLAANPSLARPYAMSAAPATESKCTIMYNHRVVKIIIIIIITL